MIQRIRTAATTANDSPFIADWDTLPGLAANGMGDDRDVMPLYLVYEIEQVSSAGTCTVTIHLQEGLPYDPQRAPIAASAAPLGVANASSAKRLHNLRAAPNVA